VDGLIDLAVKFGNQFSVCEAHVYDQQCNLVASGRGTYYTAEGKE
jgi:acyl-coenzyme A thioesterase PaaI-like protein